jgi:hypothetical protein
MKVKYIVALYVVAYVSDDIGLCPPRFRCEQ